MNTILEQSPVHFDKEKHKYTLDGEELSGVTSIINKYIFPDKYKGVSKEKLNERAAHGSLVHEQIECYNNSKWTKEALTDFLNAAEPEVHDYIKLVKSKKIKMLCSEYLVSDTSWIASCIDIIDKDYNLYDIKTTSELDLEYVRWQLSVYAYLFEFQNPGKKAGKLYGLHLRDGKAKLVEVDRISDEIIGQLITAYAMELDTFDNPLNTIGDDEESLLLELKLIQEKRKELDKSEKILTDQIRERMEKRKSHSIVKSAYKISLGQDVKTIKFDEKTFKEQKPSLWQKFTKESITKGRLTITFK